MNDERYSILQITLKLKLGLKYKVSLENDSCMYGKMLSVQLLNVRGKAMVNDA